MLWRFIQSLFGSGGTVTPASRAVTAVTAETTERLKNALTVDDLRAVGLQPDLSAPDVNTEPDGRSVYCSFTSASGAMGGIEYDAFLNDDPLACQLTVMGEGTGSYAPADLAGVDDSLISLSAVSGGPPFATIVARRGNLVFTIAIPPGPNARDQLTRLAQSALERLNGI